MFQSPAGWTAKHQAPGGLDFYSVTTSTPGTGVLMFSPWPPANRPEDIPTLVQQIADGFRKQAKQSGTALASEDYRMEQFAGSYCQGSYATFRTGGPGTNTVQTMFMISVDGRIWNGQFTGPEADWKQAITLLRSIKKHG